MELPWLLVGVLVALLCCILPTRLPKPQIVGIDLGSTYSAVGAFRIGMGGVTVIVDSDTGSVLIPSWVAFTSKGVLVGEEAMKQDLTNPENTIYGMKRFLGRKWSSALDLDTNLLPFQVLNHSGAPAVRLTYAPPELGGSTWVSPEKVQSYILQKLKSMAESHLGASVRRVVIAVPVDFDDEQIDATREAAALAGLKVDRFITEPTAAAMAYGLQDHPMQQVILVFDMGGGTLDVSILNCDNAVFTVLSVEGDNRLGGEDVNHIVMEYIVGLLRTDTYDPRGEHSRGVLQKLRDDVEAAKRKLSEEHWVVLEVSDPFDTSVRLTYNLTRAFFEELCQPLWERIEVHLTQLLSKAEMAKTDVDAVVLVGGSTRIPFLRAMIAAYFEHRIELNLKVPPEQAVAMGTALQAALIGHYWPLPTAATENWDVIKQLRIHKQQHQEPLDKAQEVQEVQEEES